MRLPALLICALPWAVGSAQQPPAATPFERLASRPSAERILARGVGSIRSTDAHVSLTALHLRDAQDPAQEMRGVRFELKSNAGLDQVYLDEEQLEAVKGELAGIEAGIPTLERDSGSPYRVQGTGACWLRDPNLRILCPDYYVGPDYSGMRLAALGGRLTFVFPGRRPAELIELIERASRALAEPGSLSGEPAH